MFSNKKKKREAEIKAIQGRIERLEGNIQHNAVERVRREMMLRDIEKMLIMDMGDLDLLRYELLELQESK